MTRKSLFMVTVVVPDMDDGIAHYTRDWGFALVEDSRHASGHRWVEIGTDDGANIRLVEATTDEHRSVVGRQAGGRVAFFLKMTGFDRTLERWAKTAIEIVEAPREEVYGRVAVVRDKFGNRWDVFDEEYRVAA